MPASRSLIALLVGTVVFFALWMIALKPSSSNNSGNKSQQGLGAFQSSINRAHQAVAKSNANDAASGNESASSSSGSSTVAHSATTSSTSAGSSKATAHKATATAHSTSKAKARTTAKPSRAPITQMSVADEMSAVRTAVNNHKVLALLFYNPAAPDDQALKHELSSVPGHKGQVVKLAIPLNDAASFTDVTQQVPVNLSPTLVLVSRAGEASEDVGYTAPFVIDQQVTDALAAAS